MWRSVGGRMGYRVGWTNLCVKALTRNHTPKVWFFFKCLFIYVAALGLRDALRDLRCRIFHCGIFHCGP